MKQVQEKMKSSRPQKTSNHNQSFRMIIVINNDLCASVHDEVCGSKNDRHDHYDNDCDSPAPKFCGSCDLQILGKNRN